VRRKVKDVMTTDVAYVSERTPYKELVRLLAAAARLLRVHLIKRLPVVDPRQRLVGIVSRSDLLSVFLRPDAVTLKCPVAAGPSALPGRPPERDAPGRHITWR
jgi:CBS-domain-containing membrane protein